MKKTTILFSLLAVATLANAQTNPAITAWLRNTTGITGRYYAKGNYTPLSNGDSANMQAVYYSSTDVYVKTQGIPAYITGPFLDGNPNEAGNQNAIFKFPLSPVKQTGTSTSVTMGNIGVFINGVALFDSRDGVSWSNSANKLEGGPSGGMGDGVWNRNAIFAEKAGFDCAKGHPAGTNYHHHQNPSAFKLDLKVIDTICSLYDADGLYTIDSTKHSPLIGFAYDGFPIYGAYAYKNVDGTGGIVRMKSSYSLRNITARNTYSNGKSVTAGPAVSSTYFLGYFREDYQYNTTSAATPDYLDASNGRFCVTPEYPKGTYCYFATVDSNWNSAYPYAVGPTFYGVYSNAKVTSVPSGVTQYTGSSLPVNLLSFTGIIHNNSTVLNWATSKEINSKSFDLERSLNASDFQKIGSVGAIGTSLNEKNYSFTDKTPSEGTNYYRLKEWDENGDFKYSNTIRVSYSKQPFSLNVFPNPAADYIIVQANELLKNDVQILLTNMKGQTVVSRTIPQGSTLSIIETVTLYAGEYVVTAYDASGYKKSYKVVIAK